jgi:hypothetical protein
MSAARSLHLRAPTWLNRCLPLLSGDARSDQLGRGTVGGSSYITWLSSPSCAPSTRPSSGGSSTRLPNKVTKGAFHTPNAASRRRALRLLAGLEIAATLQWCGALQHPRDCRRAPLLILPLRPCCEGLASRMHTVAAALAQGVSSNAHDPPPRSRACAPRAHDCAAAPIGRGAAGCARRAPFLLTSL